MATFSGPLGYYLPEFFAGRDKSADPAGGSHPDPAWCGRLSGGPPRPNDVVLFCVHCLALRCQLPYLFPLRMPTSGVRKTPCRPRSWANFSLL
jgi:hypothetical protein